MHLFIDGARLDEFTSSSGCSAFLRFADLGKLSSCRQFMPIFATGVHHSKQKDLTSNETVSSDDYIIQMMSTMAPYLSNAGVPTSIVAAENMAKPIKLVVSTLLGDYPSMLRYTNSRSGRCPFCWYRRGFGGETCLKTKEQESIRYRRANEKV